MCYETYHEQNKQSVTQPRICDTIHQWISSKCIQVAHVSCEYKQTIPMHQLVKAAPSLLIEIICVVHACRAELH